MAKTIEEIVEYTFNHETCFSGGETEIYKRGVRRGANAVLEEIESIINANTILGHPFPSLEMRFNRIVNRIKELKGE